MTIRSTDLVIRIATSLADIDGLKPHWEALEALPGNDLTFFQSFGWCRAWVAAYAAGRSSTEPRIYTVWRDDTLAAVLPLMVSDTLGLVRHLRALGEPHTQYCNLVADPDLMDAEAAALLADALHEAGICDVAVLSSVPACSNLTQVLAAFPPVPGYDNRASLLDLSVYGSVAEYTQSLGKLQKRNRNRRRNHLARRGELAFEVVWPGDADFRDLLHLALKMKKQWLRKASRFSAGLSAPGHDSFLASLDGDADALEGALLSVLRVGGEPVAIELGFLHNRHYYAYLGGFDWSLRDLSPGKVQMDMTVGWLIENGVSTYDLLGSPDDYKRSWSNRPVALNAYAKAHSWRGAIYAGAWLGSVRPAMKRLALEIPALLHRLARIGQGAACMILYV